MKGISYNLWTCDNCHELWLMSEEFLHPWYSDTCHCYANRVVRMLCALPRAFKSGVGFFDRCGNCKSRFLCVSSSPKVSVPFD